MAINKKTGMDLRAINRDQKAIDKLPNKGRVATSHSKALEKAKGEKKHESMGRTQTDKYWRIAGRHNLPKENK